MARKPKKRKVANMKLDVTEVFCPNSALRVIRHKLNSPAAKGKTFDVINIDAGNSRVSVVKLKRTSEDAPMSCRYAIEGLGKRLVGSRAKLLDEASIRLVEDHKASKGVLTA